jgi:hypothetical protein
MPPSSVSATVVLLSLLACSRNAPPARSTSIGIVGPFLDGQACLTVPDSGLSVGLRFTTATIPLAGDSSASATGIIEITAVGPGACRGLWGDYGWSDYLVREARKAVPAEGRGPAIILVSGTATLNYHDGRLQTDLNGDGAPETFRSCTSNEGLHLTLWAGTPLQSARLWHRYYPLGYDVEPSCSPADYEGP